MSAEAPQPQQMLPPEVELLRPQAANIVKPGDGTIQLEFMVTPFKVVAVLIPEESAKELAAQITSGIVIASGIPS